MVDWEVDWEVDREVDWEVDWQVDWEVDWEFENYVFICSTFGFSMNLAKSAILYRLQKQDKAGYRKT